MLNAIPSNERNKGMKNEINIYKTDIIAIKQAILESRYKAAVRTNSVQLSLYYGIGKYVSEYSRSGVWGTGAINFISEQLSRELPGLRGFSPSGIKRMRTFYETWATVFTNRPTVLDDNKNNKANFKSEISTVKEYLTVRTKGKCQVQRTIILLLA